jgi:hypothetical protein
MLVGAVAQLGRAVVGNGELRRGHFSATSCGGVQPCSIGVVATRPLGDRLVVASRPNRGGNPGVAHSQPAAQPCVGWGAPPSSPLWPLPRAAARRILAGTQWLGWHWAAVRKGHRVRGARWTMTSFACSARSG